MSDTPEPSPSKPQDLKTRFKQMTQPLADSLDSRLSAHVDRRVEEVLKDRLADIERAVADLDRAVHDLQDRLKD
jgi:ABC-type transporter Mla subunit MlaD